MINLVGDFETTTTPEDVRVWASCLIDIETFKVVHLSNSIDKFMNYIQNKNSTVYFHNLKFDGEFILYYLLTHGFKYSDTKEPKTFSALITDKGQFYNITIYFAKFNKRYHKCVINDSLKKLPFKVSQIAKAFNLEESKLHINYKEYRSPDHILTPEEEEYLIADCMIVAKALKHQFDEGLDNLTIGSDALNSFKGIIGKQNFLRWFPILPLDIDKDIRRAYRGGFTYLNPRYKEKHLQGVVFDVNSLYPSVMYYCSMPYGFPIPFEGEYQKDENYPLYIVRLRCSFTLKKDHIPTIQLKNNNAFIQTEYLTSSKGRIEELTLTNVDLELFLKHYKTQNLEYVNGYKFKSCEGIFNKYIDYWMEIKANNEGALRTLAKLMLNNLYGKFATNPLHQKKIPVYDPENDIVKYTLDEAQYLDPVYTAVGAFVTAWARYKTISSAQEVYERFIYADTDSLHLEGYEIPDNIEVHKSKLGAWKHESTFVDSKFLRAKTYMECTEMTENDFYKRDIEDMQGVYCDIETHNIRSWDVKCAGMPDEVKKQVTFDNFKINSTYSGKLQPKRFTGGVVLLPTDFTIKK